jgi:23S rRNA pseudouridine1911/1915/1917 synthase
MAGGFSFAVGPELAGKRLDVALAEHEPISRAQARRLIEAGEVRVAGAPAKPAQRLRAGEHVEGRVPEVSPSALEPEPIPLAIAFEDEHLVVLDKPPGMVVHPAPGHAHGTLVHALLHHCESLSGVGGVARPGIVHRLDKGTSGLLVVAKSDAAHRGLAEQFRAHSVDREYVAIVRGAPRTESGRIDAPISRHASDGKRFTTRGPRRARAATTFWALGERLREHSLLRVRPKTGRTHQIRVHLSSIGLPIAGDPLYGGGRRAARDIGLDRQALHAGRLGFEHPVKGGKLSFDAPLPADLLAALERLRR